MKRITLKQSRKLFPNMEYMRQICGCLTWKHELGTWLCKSITDQELGEALESGSKYLKQYYE